MLEFIYQYPLDGKNQLLKPYSDEIELLAARLEAQESPYAHLLGLVSNLSRENLDAREIKYMWSFNMIAFLVYPYLVLTIFVVGHTLPLRGGPVPLEFKIKRTVG